MTEVTITVHVNQDTDTETRVSTYWWNGPKDGELCVSGELVREGELNRLPWKLTPVRSDPDQDLFYFKREECT